MRTVAGRERDQAGAIEIDTSEMDLIGVLPAVNASGLKPDLAMLVINAIDLPDQPRPRA